MKTSLKNTSSSSSSSSINIEEPTREEMEAAYYAPSPAFSSSRPTRPPRPPNLSICASSSTSALDKPNSSHPSHQKRNPSKSMLGDIRGAGVTQSQSWTATIKPQHYSNNNPGLNLSPGMTIRERGPNSLLLGGNRAIRTVASTSNLQHTLSEGPQGFASLMKIPQLKLQQDEVKKDSSTLASIAKPPPLAKTVSSNSPRHSPRSINNNNSTTNHTNSPRSGNSSPHSRVSPKNSPTNPPTPPPLPMTTPRGTKMERRPSFFASTSSAREFADPQDLEKENKRKRQKNYLIDELIKTEIEYISDLENIVREIKEPLSRKKNFLTGENLLTEAQIATIFMNVMDLPNANKLLLKKLNHTIFGVDEFVSLEASPLRPEYDMRIGQAFIDSVPQFTPYTYYCSEQPNSNKLIQQLKNDAQFESFLEEKRELIPELKSLDLGAFLIKPMQRICKYPLFLRDMIKNTRDDHPDFKHICRALDEIDALVKDINEKKRIAEKVAALDEIHAALVFSARADVIMNRFRNHHC
eukprot:TRINITY_DN2441_c0_g1_i2.p1 TRINITY_DN2441_c0_g1~~TRINITY_DN2441_c0_g1_i2.p1  ORF type:complete len:532 (+),score=124.23 TRINITY_DN2441_c0_g1_i2:27-1598(+)